MNAERNDHFSRQSVAYAEFRPRYPAALFDLLDLAVPARELAYDCGCGSGQASVALARRYRRVIASDASLAQLQAAAVPDNVLRVHALAERAPLADGSCCLVSAAQAAHWFALPAFFAEARRVLRAGGALAVWTYQLFSIDRAVDAVVRELHDVTLARYWPPERHLVDTGYAGIELPFARRETHRLDMLADWTLAHLQAYLGTWTAVQRFRDEQGSCPLTALQPALVAAWAGRAQARVRWPLTLKLAWRD